MALNFQGSWSVTVVVKNPQALPQRFIVAGASVGNGVYQGFVGAPIVNVNGANWNLNIQAADSYDPPYSWFDSSLRTTPIRIENGFYIFEIESEDLVQDASWNDLVLQLKQAVPAPPPQPPPVVPPVVVLPPVPVTPPTPNQPPTLPPPDNTLGVGRVYTKFTLDDKLPKQRYQTTHGIWIDATGSAIGNMVTYFTASNDTGSFKRDVYQKVFDQCTASVHFDLAYGHADGSGSKTFGGLEWKSPSKAIYGQYRGLCLNPGEKLFKMGSKEIKHFYVINVKRDRMGDRLDEGNLEINLAQLSGSAFLLGGNYHTGSNVKLSGTNAVLRLIDDSTLNLEKDLASTAYSGFYQHISESKCQVITSGGPRFYIVSGTLEEGIYNKSQPQVFGLSYPNQGIIILDADLLDISASFLTTTGSNVQGDNYLKMLKSMSGSATITDLSGDYLGFQARKVKYSYMERYFVRVKNQDYNFTNNLTYQTGSEGTIIDDFYGNQKVFISEIGLFNQNYELLAVGKISKAIKKTFTEEALISVSISY